MAFSLHAAKIKGVVRNHLGQPVAGVAVIVREEGRKFLTGKDGRFEAVFPDALASVHLIFDFPGYEGETRVVEVRDYASRVDITLFPISVIMEEVTVAAPRVELPLTETSAAASVVTQEFLTSMPRAVAADEALKPVPGIKVDNQADGERVHISIRGQGILSERGIRGIQVMLDGIPVNDPSGFAPDLFDVDWAAVDKIEVIRGPLGFLYGGGSAGGVISISTRDGAAVPVSGSIWTSAGSYGFWKTMAEAGGSSGKFSYRLSASHGQGDGYRDHTAFWSNNLYGKFRWDASPRFQLSGVLAGTGFFNDNAEGLNLTWLAQNRRQANPDANTFNEYQITRRATAGLNGLWNLTQKSSLSMTFYGRSTLYRESVPSSVQHRNLLTPGFLLQYQMESGTAQLKNHLNTGMDWDWQNISEFRHPNLGKAVEGDTLVSDQDIRQNGLGLYLLDRLDFNPHWSALAGVRYDHIKNELTDHLKANGLDLSGDADFNRITARIGVTWNPRKNLSAYASWGMGFMPPATEELYANPDALGGFNAGLKPAASTGGEIGLRGNAGSRLFFNLALFHMVTHDDFERYRITARPLETFYRNAGNSRRNGLETSFSWFPVDDLTLAFAYTFSDFKYSEYASITYPGDLKGNFLPNSPGHQVFADASYRFGQNWFAGISAEGFSRAYIDATNSTWIDGYVLLGCRLGFRWVGRKLQWNVFLSMKNLTGKEYIAFTEPDPDGNSYQPGPTREFFATIQLRF